MVTMYKLAEQIIQEEKKIHVPSYFGIIKEHDIEFKEVIIDGRYDRIDKQPDVIATTTAGEQLLIEFTFDYKVQHKEIIDYQNLNCIEINLSNQTLESLYDFLLNSNEDKKWINNQSFFDSIESRYSEQGKKVKVKSINDCATCAIKERCCGVRLKDQYLPVKIYNSGQTYHICKTEQYEELKRHQEAEQKQAMERLKLLKERLSELPEMRERRRKHREETARLEAARREEYIRQLKEEYQSKFKDTSNIDSELPSCFMCIRNIDWMCINDEYAHCESFIEMKVPKDTPPETAIGCRGFIKKLSKTSL